MISDDCPLCLLALQLVDIHQRLAGVSKKGTMMLCGVATGYADMPVEAKNANNHQTSSNLVSKMWYG